MSNSFNEDKSERVYSPHHLEETAIDKSLTRLFAQIISKDSGKKSFGFSTDILSIRCIDLDEMEIQRTAGKGNRSETMDCAIMIAKFRIPQRDYVASRALLVELKLNCDSHTLDIKDYTDKISHTRNLLSGVTLHPNNIFLFKDSVRSKAERDVFNWSRGSQGKILKSVLVMSPGGFNDYIGFEHQYPYQPQHSSSKIEQELNESASDIDLLTETITKWKAEAQTFRFRNNKQESNHILETIRQTVSPIINNMAEGEDRTYLQLYLDDLL